MERREKRALAFLLAASLLCLALVGLSAGDPPAEREEALFQAGREEFDRAYAERLAAGAAASARQTVILTGVGFEPGKTGFLLWKDGESSYYAHEKSACGGYGTGDVFAAAFTGALLSGIGTEQAARIAAEYTGHCAARTAQDPAHWYGLEFEPELSWLIRRLEERE